MSAHLTALRAMQRFAREAPKTSERCEGCGAAIGTRHAHLLEPARDDLRCSCEGCASRPPSGWKLVPTRVRRLDAIRLDAADWRALGIPVELAFLRALSPRGVMVAHYPGPAGAIRTELQSDVWHRVRRLNPELEELESDVEALLADRRETVPRYYIAPIDECFRLVGWVRSAHAGRTGDDGLRAQLRGFFAELDARAEHRCA